MFQHRDRQLSSQTNYRISISLHHALIKTILVFKTPLRQVVGQYVASADESIVMRIFISHPAFLLIGCNATEAPEARG